MFIPLIILVLSFMLVHQGCDEDKITELQGTMFLFDLSGEGDFWDYPFPSDLRRCPDGFPDFSNMPNLAESQLIDIYREFMISEKADYSLAGGIFFRMDGPIDEARLPKDPSDSLSKDSKVFLMDVDPDSSSYGIRIPILCDFKADEVTMGPAYVLSLIPVPGYVLKPHTLYAAVILSGLRDIDGKRLGSPLALERLKSGKTPEGEWGKDALDLYGPVFGCLEEQGINRDNIAAMTVFTTGHSAEGLIRMAEYVHGIPAPGLKGTLSPEYEYESEYEDFYVIRGVFNAPQYQSGVPPFEVEGGGIMTDNEGNPVEQYTDEVVFRITIPRGTMPLSGWPLLLYIHGTEGLSNQFVHRNGCVSNPANMKPDMRGRGPAQVLARRGIAAAGHASVHNPERGNFSFFQWYNFLNPCVMRDNFRQAALDAVMFLKLLKNLRIDESTCPGCVGVIPMGEGLFFDSDNLFAMGQSQGSVVLGLFAPLVPEVRAIVPSGSGAHWGLHILYMTEPAPIRPVVAGYLGLEEDELDIFHPLITMIQTAMEPADTLVYGRYIIHEPLFGAEPRHVYIPFGIPDGYFHPPQQIANAMSIGVDLGGAIVEHEQNYMPDILPLFGRNHIVDFPVSLNISTPKGYATGGAVQYANPPDIPCDGHNISFSMDEVKYQYGCFLETAVNGQPRIPAPRKDWDEPCQQ